MPKKEERQIGPLYCASTALPPMNTMDLLDTAREVMRSMGAASGIGPKFRTVLPQLLAGTKASWTDAASGKQFTVTLNNVPNFDAAFDDRMEFVAPVIRLALEVSFIPFLDGVASLGDDHHAEEEESQSSDSSPSTSDTGSATAPSSPAT